MRYRIGLIASSMAAMSLAPLTVRAQAPAACAPRADVLKQLSSKYRENPIAVGVAENGALLEVLASSDGATWTALVTRANGVSCVVMSGEAWQNRAPHLMVGLPL